MGARTLPLETFAVNVNTSIAKNRFKVKEVFYYDNEKYGWKSGTWSSNIAEGFLRKSCFLFTRKDYTNER